MARLSVAVLALLVAALALAVTASAGAVDFGGLDAMVASKTCRGDVGECAVDEDDELGLAGGAEALRRSLARAQRRYISYEALKADSVPCSKRGRSYYDNCAAMKPANPYTRGCSAITRCARTMD